MEDPDIPEVLKNLDIPGLTYDEKDTTYFLGRETIMASKRPGMALWREKIFSLISQNATSATAYFCLPPDRVVEMGERDRDLVHHRREAFDGVEHEWMSGVRDRSPGQLVE